MINFLNALSWQSKALIAVAIFVTGFVFGARYEGFKNEASQGRSIAKQEKTREIVDKNTNQIVTNTQTETKAIETHHRKIREAIHEQNDNRICFADNAALQLWNSAITGKDTYTSERDAAATGTAAAENQEIVATVEQVIANGNENFEISRKNMALHKSCIAFLHEIDGKACVCGD